MINIFSRSILLGYLIINIFTIVYVKCAVRIAAELCGGKCAETDKCTHFTWSNYNGGTCWMKKGAGSKDDTVSTSDSTMICGVRDGTGGGGGDGNIINEQTFACVFNSIDSNTRASRFSGLRESGWKPAIKDEAAVFLAHVFHETDGLKAMREYCAPGDLPFFLLCIELCWIVV
ncbi:unnamed protein product [Adineta ricciae]|uniref:Apple domain-containing protein n=1 Tax=Adineta ricciae TaxID=249248 RepID=A0A815SV09_ADIRI|nr:unnamed protein product [Adineta ricciae]CAF1494813.1 unnamed protein product [Adineta ricciae]